MRDIIVTKRIECRGKSRNDRRCKQEQSDGTTRYRTTIQLTGLLSSRMPMDKIQDGFDRQAAALKAVEAKPKGTMVTNEIEIGIEGSQTPALVYEMVVLYNPPRS